MDQFGAGLDAPLHAFRSAREGRKDNREDCPSPTTLENQFTLVFAHYCFLYEEADSS